MKKTIFPVVLVVLAGLVGWRLYQKHTTAPASQRPAGPATVSVQVAAVTNLLLRAEQPVYGTLEARSAVVVAPKIAGRVRTLAADLGDVVTNGQVLAVLDEEEYVQAVEQARADRAVARASAEESRINLVLATQETVRVQALAAKGIVSDAERETAVAQEAARRARQDVALATAAQREAALRLAELRLGYTRIAAEWAGNGTRAVGQCFVDEGALLRANDPLLSLVDLESLTAVVKVTAQEYARLSVGQTVAIVADALPGERFPGRIVRIAPVLEAQTREAQVEIDLPNPERRLAPGQFVRAVIELASRPDARAVPGAALVRRNGQSGVFVVDGAALAARFVPVRTGLQDRDYVEILEPALEGEVVVLGQHLLEDGSPLAIQGREPRPKGPRP